MSDLYRDKRKENGNYIIRVGYILGVIALGIRECIIQGLYPLIPYKPPSNMRGCQV